MKEFSLNLTFDNLRGLTAPKTHVKILGLPLISFFISLCAADYRLYAADAGNSTTAASGVSPSMLSHK